MSGYAAPGALPSRPGRRPADRGTDAAIGAPATIDARRALQLALAGLWVLDGVLQLQPFMFTKDFARQMLAPSAHGNPAVIAGPITAVASLVARHPVGANAGFAATQILLGLAIAWRPTVKAGLAASIGWALAVWWLGEGLGGILTGTAGPVAGGPGAALLYALLSLAVWPVAGATTGRPGRVPFVAAGRLGVPAARLTWLLLWAGLAGFAMQGANRSAQGLHDLVDNAAMGQPGWLAAIGHLAAQPLAHRGLAGSAILAVLLLLIGVAVFGPPALVRGAVIAAVALATLIWFTAEALGGVFGGQSTDPDTGPLLILLALAYWPLSLRATSDSQAGPTC